MQDTHTSLEGFYFSKFKGVLIDIDDTLYSYSLPHRSAVSECFSVFTNEFNATLKYEDFYSDYTKSRLAITELLKPQGSCRSRLFAFDMLFRSYGIKKSYNLANKYEDIYWKKFISEMKINTYALDFLKKCMHYDLLVCAVTDMQAHIQIQKLKALCAIDYVDFIATSEEAGAEKPDKKIFNLALQKMHLQKRDVVMIGDSISKDIEGATSFGIKAIHFKA